MLRTKFVKLSNLRNACSYCSKVVSSDHIARWASHFRSCSKVYDTDRKAYYNLGTDPTLARFYRGPRVQAPTDLDGIELVLKASEIQIPCVPDVPKKAPKRRKKVVAKDNEDGDDPSAEGNNKKMKVGVNMETQTDDFIPNDGSM